MEVLTTVHALKNNKSLGIDNIPTELLKEGGYLWTRVLHQYILRAWEEESIPLEWKDVNVITIYKNKGDKFICVNGRGIALLSVASKVLAKVMLQRLINTITAPMLPESQCGFRKNRSMVDMIFMTRQLQEKCRNNTGTSSWPSTL